MTQRLKGVFMHEDNEFNAVMTQRETLPEQFKIQTSQTDLLIPNLKIIQSLSNELTPNNAKYNPDVKAGDIYDSVTKTIFKNAKAIVCGMLKYYAEWTPQVRGRLIKKHPENSEVVKRAIQEAQIRNNDYSNIKLKTPAGNDLQENFGAVLVMKNENGIILPEKFTFSKTSFMVGKELSTIIAVYQNGGIPEFDVSTVLVSNDKGSWYKPCFKFSGYAMDRRIISLAAKLHAIADEIILG